MVKKGIKASFTVEAAVIVPFILFLSIGALRLGIEFYQDSVHREQDMRILEMDSVEYFFQLQMLERLGKDMNQDGT